MILAALGGLMVIAGALLPWVRVTATYAGGGAPIEVSSQSMAAAGTEHWTGLSALGAGVAVAGAAAVWAMGGRRWQGRRVAALAMVAALVVLAAAGVASTTRTAMAESSLGDFLHGAQQAARIGATIGVEVRVGVEAGPGLYEAAAGGAVLALAGAFSLRRPARGRAAAP